MPRERITDNRQARQEVLEDRLAAGEGGQDQIRRIFYSVRGIRQPVSAGSDSAV